MKSKNIIKNIYHAIINHDAKTEKMLWLKAIRKNLKRHKQKKLAKTHAIQ
jgi:hypothetical protein